MTHAFCLSVRFPHKRLSTWQPNPSVISKVGNEAHTFPKYYATHMRYATPVFRLICLESNPQRDENFQKRIISQRNKIYVRKLVHLQAKLHD